MSQDTSIAQTLGKVVSSAANTLYENEAKETVSKQLGDAIRLSCAYDASLVELAAKESRVALLNGSTAAKTQHHAHAIGRELATVRAFSMTAIHRKKTTLVLSPSGKELDFYKKSVTYCIMHFEPKDISRLALVVAAKAGAGKSALKLDGKTTRLFMDKSAWTKLDLLTVMRMLGYNVVTSYEEIAQLDYKIHVVVALDSLYNADETQIRRIQEVTGAMFWVATLWLPIELTLKNVMRHPDYRLRFHKGFVDAIWESGETGYHHSEAEWTKWLVKPFIGGVQWELHPAHSDIYTLVGVVSAGEAHVSRIIHVPKWREMISVLDLEKVYDFGEGKIKTAERLLPGDYFDAPALVVEDLIAFVSRLEKETDRTTAVLCNYAYRQQTMSHSDRRRTWAWSTLTTLQIKIVIGCVLVYAKIDLIHEQMKAAEVESGKAATTNFMRFIRTLMIPVIWPIEKIGDLIHMLWSRDRVKILFKEYPVERVLHATHVAPEIDLASMELLTMDEMVDVITDEQHECPLCGECGDVGEQRLVCDHYGNESTYNYAFEEAMRNDLMMNKLIVGTDDPAKMVFKELFDQAKAAMPQVGAKVAATEFIVGPPGTGKSYIIKLRIKPSVDAVVVPFSKLLKDYTDTPAIRVFTQHKALIKLGIVDTLYVDEYTALDYQLLVAIVLKTHARRVVLVGDRKQTGIRPGEGIAISDKIPEDRYSRMTLTVNFRNPGNVVRALAANFGYHIIATKPDQAVSAYPFSEIDETYEVVTFGGITALDADGSTSRKNQGSTLEKECLYLTSADIALSKKDSLLIVGLTRGKHLVLAHDGHAETIARCDEILGMLSKQKKCEPFIKKRLVPFSTISELFEYTVPVVPGPVHEAIEWHHDLLDRAICTEAKEKHSVSAKWRELLVSSKYMEQYVKGKKVLAIGEHPGRALHYLSSAAKIVSMSLGNGENWLGPENVSRIEIDCANISAATEFDFLWCDLGCDDQVKQDACQAYVLNWARLRGAPAMVKLKVLGPKTRAILKPEQRVIRLEASNPLSSEVFVTDVDVDRTVPMVQAWAEISSHYQLSRKLGHYLCRAPGFSAKVAHMLDFVGEKQDFVEAREMVVPMAEATHRSLNSADFDMVEQGTPVQLNLEHAAEVARRLAAEGRRYRTKEQVREKQIKTTAGALIHGNRFIQGSDAQTLACMLQRYVGITTAEMSTPGLYCMMDMATKFWIRQGRPVITENMLAIAAGQAYAKMELKQYEQRMNTRGEYDPKFVMFRIKEGIKAKMDPADFEKVAQGVNGRPAEHWMSYAVYTRAMTEAIETEPTNTITTMHGRSDAQFVDEFAGKIARMGGKNVSMWIDQTENDSRKNKFTQAMEAFYMHLTRWDSDLIQAYFDSRTDFKVVAKNFSAISADKMPSGDALTLASNNLSTGCLMNKVIRSRGGVDVQAVQGDDGAIVGPDLSIDEDALAEVQRYWPIKLKIERGDVIPFCGKLISAEGVTVNVPLRVLKLMGGIPRETRDIVEWRKAAKDLIKLIDHLGEDAHHSVMKLGGWNTEETKQYIDMLKAFNKTPIKELLRRFRVYNLDQSGMVMSTTSVVQNELEFADRAVARLASIGARQVRTTPTNPWDQKRYEDHLTDIFDMVVDAVDNKVADYVWEIVDELADHPVRATVRKLAQLLSGNWGDLLEGESSRTAYVVGLQALDAVIFPATGLPAGVVAKLFFKVLNHVVRNKAWAYYNRLPAAARAFLSSA